MPSFIAEGPILRIVKYIYFSFIIPALKDAIIDFFNVNLQKTSKFCGVTQ